jgi:hypothetical protein
METPAITNGIATSLVLDTPEWLRVRASLCILASTFYDV